MLGLDLARRAVRATRWGLMLSAGAACVERDALPGAAAAMDTLRGAVVLEIGEEGGPDEYLFGSVVGLVRDSIGRIFVADAQVSEVRAYAPDGRFLFRVARQGAGPGEVHGPCCLALDDEGRLWVRDGGNGRYQAYRLGRDQAEYEREVRFQHGDQNLWAPLTFDTAGRLVDVGHTSPISGGEPVQIRFHIGLDGALHGRVTVPTPSADSIDMEIVERRTARGFARLYVYQPYGSIPLVAHGPLGTWATAASGYYVIRWVLPDGTVRIVSRDVSGPQLAQAEVRWAADDLAATAERVGVTAARLPFGVPARKAPLTALWFDRAGRLWVVRASEWPGRKAAADIYDTTGALVAAAQWPRSIELRHGAVDDQVALGVRTDSLGVQRVVLITWSEPGPAR